MAGMDPIPHGHQNMFKQNGWYHRPATACMVCFLLITAGCSPRPGVGFEKAISLFKENKLEQALPLFKAWIAAHGDDADAFAWLAETCRRLGMKHDAVQAAFKALEIEPCHSVAHTVIADACHRPPGATLQDSDTTWSHINRAVECDACNGNAWMFLCVEAMLRGKFDLMHKSARKLIETGFLTNAVLAYGKWMLRTLPESAILITNGDMDTFPLLALQAAENFRTDVAVVEKQWMGLQPYLTYLREYRQVHLPLEASQIDATFRSHGFPENMLSVADSVFHGWLRQNAAGTSSRPLAVAVTVTENFYADEKDHFRYAGPFWIWTPGSAAGTPDTLSIAKSIAGLRSEDFEGPWVSARDYSPVRIINTKELVRNITSAALVFVEASITAKDFTGAEDLLDWAEAFEKKTELGYVSSLRISDLRAMIRQRRY